MFFDQLKNNEFKFLYLLGVDDINFKKKLINPKSNKVDFIESDILIHPIDYYYTNPIARSSKVMNECKQISKNYFLTPIEKAS